MCSSVELISLRNSVSLCWMWKVGFESYRSVRGRLATAISTIFYSSPLLDTLHLYFFPAVMLTLNPVCVRNSFLRTLLLGVEAKDYSSMMILTF